MELRSAPGKRQSHGLCRTESQIYKETATEYLDTLDPLNPPSPGKIELELVRRTQIEFKLENMSRQPSKADRELVRGLLLVLPQRLANVQVSMIVQRLHHVKAVLMAGNDPDLAMLAIYETGGPNEGLYVASEIGIQSVIARYSPNINTADINEIMRKLRRESPITPASNGTPVAHLSVVANGIWNHLTQQLDPFSPDYVFMARASCVAYDATAQNVVIKMPDGILWDMDSWMAGLSDDPEIVELLWEIIGAIVRPNVRWNKTAWFYADVGNNGKGTLSALLRNLVGQASTATLSIKDFGKDFMLEPLIKTSAIITDENDVGTFIDEAANIKAIITNDPISINRKGRVPIAYLFWGFMVQCLNGFPLIKDKSESFLRRLLLIPFNKSYTGVERQYIKDEYLCRDDVLRYVLKRALHMTHTELSQPAACVAALDEFRAANDPRFSFWREFENQFVWDFLPFRFIYELYRAWSLKTNPDGRPGSQHSLTSFLKSHLATSETWEHMGTKAIRPGRMLSIPEPLIVEYDLKDWTNNSYTGNEVSQRALPYPLKTNYTGLMRRSSGTVADGVGEDKDETDQAAP